MLHRLCDFVFICCHFKADCSGLDHCCCYRLFDFVFKWHCLYNADCLGLNHCCWTCCTWTEKVLSTKLRCSFWQRRQSGLKTGGCGSGFENRGSWVLKVQQTEAWGKGSSKLLYNINKLFLKSHHFGKCSHLILPYIIGYNNIWDPTTQPL